MRLYFDTCCYNRPFDNLAQERVEQEADVILAIVARAYINEWEIVGSAAIIAEITAIADDERRTKVAAMYRIATKLVKSDESVKIRAEELQREGMHAMDSLHVALAEKAKATFITVDDKLLKICKRLKLNAMNPLDCLRGVVQNED